jgi:hypothetical protein
MRCFGGGSWKWVASLAVLLFAFACGGGGSNGTDETPTDPGTEGTKADVRDVLDFGQEEEAMEVEEDLPSTDVPVDVPVTTDPGLTDPGIVDVPEDAGTPPCTKDEDCVGSDIALKDCQKAVCDENSGKCVPDWDGECCLTTPADHDILFANFENGVPSGWTVDVPPTNGAVTWGVSKYRWAFGTDPTDASQKGSALYFGDPKCHKYYNGEMDALCAPVDPAGKDAGRVYGSITTSEFVLPPVKGKPIASFYLWAGAEGVLPVEQQPDLLRTLVVQNPGASETAQPVFSSMSVGKDTEGLWVYVAIDLAAYAGKKIALRLSFDTLDANNNYFEGIYVDQLRVFSICDPVSCKTTTPCVADENECTSDECTLFANQPSQGFCAHAPQPKCFEPTCTATNYLEKCATDDPCQIPSCEGGECAYAMKPECCTEVPMLTKDFDDGAIQGFMTWAYQDNEQVRWQVSNKRAASGQYSLHYGDSLGVSFDTPGTMNMGEATSEEISIAGDGFAFLTFNLFLSTEFDITVPDNYYNPLGADLLEVIAIQNLGDPTKEKKTTIWSSDLIRGSTHGQFMPVGIGLSNYVGKVWIRFRFQTSDASHNNYEGVYIDDIKVVNNTCTQQNCMTEYDCGFDGVCRKGTCTDKVCKASSDVAQDCCATQSDCDDGNPCTMDGCIDHVCYREFVESPNCCQMGYPIEFAFDQYTDLDGFTVEDTGIPGPAGKETKWQLSDARSVSEPRSLYFGNGTNYFNEGRSRGTATSPQFLVPLYGVLSFEFSSYLDLDADTDVLTAVLIPPSGNPVSIFDKANVPVESYRTWFKTSGIDLTPYKGQLIQVRFFFDSVNHINNVGEGVYIDDIRIRRDCPK